MRIFIAILFFVCYMNANGCGAEIVVENKSQKEYECYFAYINPKYFEIVQSTFELGDGFFYKFNENEIVQYSFQIAELGIYINHYALPDDTIKIKIINDNFQFESKGAYVKNRSSVGKKMRDLYSKTKNFQLYLDSGKSYLKEDLDIINDENYSDSLLKKIHLESAYFDYYTEIINFLLENTIWSSRVKNINIEAVLDTFLDYNYLNRPLVKNSFGYSSLMDRYFRLKTGILKNYPVDVQKDVLLKNLNGFGLDAIIIQTIKIALENTKKSKDLKQIRNSVSQNNLISNGTQQGLLSLIDSKMNFSKGMSFPISEIEDINGDIFNLNEYKGKVIIFDFWSTWCGPCIKEMPQIKEMMDMLKNDDVILITLSIDDNFKKWNDFIKKQNINGIHLCLGGGFGNNILNKLKITSIPRAIVLDKEHKIYDFNYNANSIKEAVRELKNLAKK